MSGVEIRTFRSGASTPNRRWQYNLPVRPLKRTRSEERPRFAILGIAQGG
jgi:hypothetical protein